MKRAATIVMQLLIAIPALNEEQSIRGTIQRCLEAEPVILQNSPVTSIEVAVVSDGSTDRTAERAREFGSLINLIEVTKNQGYGAAILEAWSESPADLLSFLDTDGAVEVDMPYAERKGDSKLRVGRNGFRFLRVIHQSLWPKIFSRAGFESTATGSLFFFPRFSSRPGGTESSSRREKVSLALAPREP